METKYLTVFRGRNYKLLRLGRLYIEWWGHSKWHAAATYNFYQAAIGRLGLAWARFRCS